jgi:hypothetical protein
MSGPRVAVVGGYAFGFLSESALAGFRAAGCRAELVPYQNWTPRVTWSGRGSGLATRAATAVARPFLEALLVETVAALDADLVFFVKCDDLSAGCYRTLRRRTRAKLFAFHPDDPFRHGSALRPTAVHPGSRVQLREVDAFFIWSHALVDKALAAGARRAFYLPFASDPAVHHPVPITEADRAMYGADVCFVGNWDAHREAWLSALTGFDLAIWGADYWSSRCANPRLRAAWRGRALVGDEMAKAAICSKVNINVLREQNKDACNMRTFEIPATGGFLLHEQSRDLPALFPPGVACDTFASPEELRAKVAHYLAHDAERTRIAEAGLARARTSTYTEWARRVIDVHASMR